MKRVITLDVRGHDARIPSHCSLTNADALADFSADRDHARQIAATRRLQFTATGRYLPMSQFALLALFLAGHPGQLHPPIHPNSP